ADLRVWRDLNSDGISQSNELFTLDDLGIASLSTDGTRDVNTNLGNGNSILNEGTFTRTDGSTGTMADLALQEQTVYREFTDNVTITSEAAALPNVVATGPLRDLREAMSLDTNGNLTNLVRQYSEATTRAGQIALLDNLLNTWAATSGFDTLPGGDTYTFATIDRATQPDEYAAAQDKIRVLESFTGQVFVNGNRSAGNIIEDPYFISVEQMSLMNQSYEAMRDYVYQSLVIQTRLSEFSDSIGLSFDGTDLALDFTAMEAVMQARVNADPTEGLIDILEFNEFTGDSMRSAGWESWTFVADVIRSAPSSAEIQAVLDEFGITYVAQAGELDPSHTGTNANEILLGNETNDTINGSGGNDTIAGGLGNDTALATTL
ncbi:MAG: hypothetical protein GXP08_11700, partial [Gammaproteobacteria bacterium]|nr:hypothetical protein [Gammaproteobacteria bacterium]